MERTVIGRAIFSVAAMPGITRPPNYRTAPPIPASEIIVALIAVAALVGLGIAVALLWSRIEARGQLPKPGGPQ